MRFEHRSAVWLSSASLAALAGISAAQAGAFALREQSAYGQGMAFAGIAAGGSVSSMFWNPATLSHVEGIEIEKVVSGVSPFAEVDYGATIPTPDGGFIRLEGHEDDVALDAVVPAGYGAYRLNERLVLGFGVNAPFGLATKYDMESPIRALGFAGTSKVFSLNANPSVAYQLSDWLTLAVGAQVQYLKVRLTDQTIAPGAMASLEGDDIGFGLTAGVQITPWQGTEIGLGYRSRIDHELDADLALNVTGVRGDFEVDGEDFDLPDVVTFGVRQHITDAFRLAAGVEWSNWSRFEEVLVTGGPADIPLGFHYEDGWFFSAGAEYDVTSDLTLRGGIGYEISPVVDEARSFRLPDNDRLWLSAGASYQATERFGFDLGYTLILPETDTEIRASEAFGGDGPDANGPFAGEANAEIHVISAGFKLKFGGQPAPGVMDQPVVAKY